MHLNFHALLPPAQPLQDLQISHAIPFPVVAGTCIFPSERSSTPLDIRQGSSIKPIEALSVFGALGKAGFKTPAMTDRKGAVCLSSERADLLEKPQERNVLCS